MIRKNEKCSKCEKIGVIAKSLCHACYSKMRRETPEGKLILQKYNQTKGKLAQKKWRDSKPKKEPKERVNKICECGTKAIAKGLCRNCYQKQRNIIINVDKVKKVREKIDFTPIYKKVLNHVKNGNTIETACKLSNIDRRIFYNKINDFQKKELRLYKEEYKHTKTNDFYNLDDLY